MPRAVMPPIVKTASIQQQITTSAQGRLMPSQCPEFMIASSIDEVQFW
jgi:hypothetical protein